MSKLSSTLCSSPSFRCTTNMLVCLEWRGEALVGWLTLFLLLDDLFKVHKLKPNVKWRQAFEIYLKTMPPYYLMVKQHSSIGFSSSKCSPGRINVLTSGCCCFSSSLTALKKGTEDDGCAPSDGREHGLWPELQRHLLPEEAQPTGKFPFHQQHQ